MLLLDYRIQPECCLFSNNFSIMIVNLFCLDFYQGPFAKEKFTRHVMFVSIVLFSTHTMVGFIKTVFIFYFDLSFFLTDIPIFNLSHLRQKWSQLFVSFILVLFFNFWKACLFEDTYSTSLDKTVLLDSILVLILAVLMLVSTILDTFCRKRMQEIEKSNWFSSVKFLRFLRLFGHYLVSFKLFVLSLIFFKFILLLKYS